MVVRLPLLGANLTCMTDHHGIQKSCTDNGIVPYQDAEYPNGLYMVRNGGSSSKVYKKFRL